MPRIELRHGIINPKRNNMQDKVREHNRKKKRQAQDAVKKGAAVLQKG